MEKGRRMMPFLFALEGWINLLYDCEKEVFMFHINAEDSLFLFVDFQERLMPAMAECDQMVANSVKAMDFCKLMDIDYLFTTQYKRGLGDLIDGFKAYSDEAMDKTEFSCYANADIKKAIDWKNKKNIIILGQETHVCVFQTARDLIEAGYNVFLMEDAITSRDLFNKESGLRTLRYMGARMVNLELVIFDILHDSKNPAFKEAQALIK